MANHEQETTNKESPKNPLYPDGGPKSQFDRPLNWWETMSVEDKLKGPLPALSDHACD